MEEEYYLAALAAINSEGFEPKQWLKTYFMLYRSTLNWPENLPPINRSYLPKGTLKEKFNFTYKEILEEVEYLIENETQTLIIFSLSDL